MEHPSDYRVPTLIEQSRGGAAAAKCQHLGRVRPRERRVANLGACARCSACARIGACASSPSARAGRGACASGDDAGIGACASSCADSGVLAAAAAQGDAWGDGEDASLPAAAAVSIPGHVVDDSGSNGCAKQDQGLFDFRGLHLTAALVRIMDGLRSFEGMALASGGCVEKSKCQHS